MKNNLTLEYIYDKYECKCNNDKKCINPTLIFNEIITQAYSSIIINKTEQKTKQ